MPKSGIVASVVIAMSLAAPAAAADQFNVVCDLTQTLRDGIEVSDKFASVVAIDLDNKKWAFTNAKGQFGPVKDIHEISAQEILLSKPDADGNGTVISLDRYTGRFYQGYVIGYATDGVVFGSCEKAAFTPFPEQKF